MSETVYMCNKGIADMKAEGVRSIIPEFQGGAIYKTEQTNEDGKMGYIMNTFEESSVIPRQVSDQELIKKELAEMGQDEPRLELLFMVPEFGRERSPEQLRYMRERAYKETEQYSPMAAALVGLFFNAAISYSKDIAEKEKGHQDGPYVEPAPVAEVKESLPRQDESISFAI